MNFHGGQFHRENVSDFSVNIPELEFPLGFEEVIKDALLQVRKYPDIDGMNAKKSIAEYNDTEVDQIVLGNGATELIYLMSRALDIKRATIIQPTFTEYERALVQNNVDVKHYYLKPENDFKLDKDELVQHLIRTSSDLLVLCNPNNPTGTFIEMDTIEAILLRVKKSGLMLMIDESFMDFVSDYRFDQHRDRLNVLMKSHSILVIRSMTKNFMIPGIRLGYAIGSKKIISAMNKLKEPWSINGLALACIPFLLGQNNYLVDLRNWCQGEFCFMLSKLNEIEQLTVFESTTNFILFRLDMGSPKEFMSSIIKGGAYIRTCEDFEGLDHRYFRIALRNREENIKLIKLIMEAI
ncbi:MAG: aminotransferase class I/II-fold pyridoxal phosphate-dependent enzyme [Clostridia bacterium]|nr:aminotransferase class I/II-fold pyridoxal phosphate-dependent enzyme [Clostridia bacterium]